MNKVLRRAIRAQRAKCSKPYRFVRKYVKDRYLCKHICMYIYRKPNQIVAIGKPKVKINHIATSKPMPKTYVANN